MKKILEFLCIIVMAGCMAGCGNGNKVTKKEVKDTECVDSAYFNTMSDIVESENGYYILNHTYNGSYITYKDKKNLECEVFLCGKPDCKHIDLVNDRTLLHMFKDCNAYVGEGVLESIKYYKGNLYVIVIETGQAVLYRISKDGSSHERLFELGSLSKNLSHLYNYVVDDDYVYTTYQGEGFKKNELSQVCRFSLKDGTKEVILEDTEYHFNTIKLYNGGLFFRRMQSEGSETIICRYDCATGKTEDIAAGAVTMYTIDNSHNSVLYWRLGEGLIRYDLNTGNEKLIRPSGDNMVDVQLACNGKYVVLNNTNSWGTEGFELMLEAIDLETEKVAATIPCQDKVGAIYNCDTELLIAYHYATSGYAYIRIEDIAAGRPFEWQDWESFREQLRAQI